MKKIIAVMLLAGSVLWADVKPIFIMVYDPGCKACQQTIRLIAKNKELSGTILNLTKPFQMTIEQAKQNNLLVRSVPTFFLLDPNTNEMLVKPLEGGIENASDFSRFLRQVYNALNNKY